MAVDQQQKHHQAEEDCHLCCTCSTACWQRCQALHEWLAMKKASDPGNTANVMNHIKTKLEALPGFLSPIEFEILPQAFHLSLRKAAGIMCWQSLRIWLGPFESSDIVWWFVMCLYSTEWLFWSKAVFHQGRGQICYMQTVSSWSKCLTSCKGW